METEILVHVKAPARIADDKKYVSIAQGVLNFEPSVTTKVIDGSDGQNDSSLAFVTESHLQSDNSSSGSRLSRKQLSLQTERVAGGMSSTTPRQLGQKRVFLGVSKACSSPQVLPRPELTDDLKCNGSIPGGLGPLCSTPVPAIHNCSTETAVEILVPDTTNQSRKRNWSEAFGADHELTVVSDSQFVNEPAPSAYSDLCQCSDSRKQCRDDLRLIGTGSKIYSLADTTPRTILSKMVPKGTQADTALHDMRVSHSSQHADQEGSTKSEQPLMHNACTKDLASLTSLACGTLKKQQLIMSTPDRRHHNNLLGSSIVDIGPLAWDNLIKPPTTTHGVHHQHSRQADLVNTSDVPSTAITSANSRSVVSSLEQPFPSIWSLPLVINAPLSDKDWLSSRVSEHPILNATAEALSLPKDFRPQSMARAVSEKERGYWKVPIKIVTPIEAVETRTLTTGRHCGDTDTSWRPLLKYSSLTEAEFLEVWEELDNFVSRGNAGRSIRIIRRGSTVLSGKGPIDRSAHFHLQVFCYGEAIPYLYAMLLVCTRMYAICHPLEWISTIDDKTVITMEGQDTHKGHLPGWAGHKDKHGIQHWMCGEP